MYEINRKQLAERLLQATGSKNYAELCEKMGVNRGTVSDWVTKGKTINFQKILEVFGEEVDWNYIMVGRVGGVMLTQVRKLQADVEKLAKTLQEMENK